MTEPRARGGCGLAAAGLGGFVLGAGSVLLIVWATLREPARETPTAPVASPTTTAAPAVPRDRGRPHGPEPAAVPPPADLTQRDLLLPVQGVARTALTDNFHDPRGERTHEALDIMAPRGTPVMATDDGKIAKIFTSERGGLTLYQFDPTETYTYYYAHLDRYGQGLVEGGAVRRGQVLGYVGTTGNAGRDSPHLHFAIFRVGPEKRWWEGTPINPFPLFR
ncbi:MAG TPA: M23 family metallopeptidase [Thermoanaerobaculia bacterium]|nr:M23 family metallopeptidase [Thermoanaerobaculia bacterium]